MGSRKREEEKGRQTMIEQVIVNRLESEDDTPIIVPVYLPEMDKILAFANDLAKANIASEGFFEGWPYGFSPYDPNPPHLSRAPFKPAMFFLGAFSIWSVHLDWNDGNDNAPDILVMDEQIVRNGKIPTFRTTEQIFAEIEENRQGRPYAKGAPYYRITQVEHIENYLLRVTFNDGKTFVVDLAHYVLEQAAMYQQLQDIRYFAQVKVADDLCALVWPNHLDIEPHELYELAWAQQQIQFPKPNQASREMRNGTHIEH